MKTEIINWSPEKCKQKILEYQKTKDVQLRNNLLFKYDLYLIHLSVNLKKRYSYLSFVQLRDIYHTAIVGFQVAIDRFSIKAPAELIIPVIKNYVKNELHKAYKHHKHEHYKENLEVDSFIEVFDNSFDRFEKEQQETSAHLLIDTHGLTIEEKDLLRLYYVDGLTFTEVALFAGLTRSTAVRRIKLALGKLKTKIDNWNER